MSHVIGPLISLAVPARLGPDFGTLTLDFEYELAPPPFARFLLLRFENASIPAGSRLEVELGYGGQVDTFTAADGAEFWTRPVKVHEFPGERVPIRYSPGGAAIGGVELTMYGRAQRSGGGDRPETFTNVDPFLRDSPYIEPEYDPLWICHVEPDWQDIACLPDGDLRRTVGRSTCMLVMAHGDHLSTCSGTLVDHDLVLSAGHCLSESDRPSPVDSLAAASASVVFDYEIGCTTRDYAPGHEPKVFKIVDVVEYGYDATSGKDYTLLRIATPPGGTGFTPVPMRTDLPAAGEAVFAIHHPNGAVKKHSPRSTGYSQVVSSTASFVRAPFDVAGGSSGSGLFDTLGNVVGVLANDTCTLNYFPTASMLQDIGTVPPPVDVPRDVMVVVDRSGSMTGNTDSGLTKMDEARDAVALFVSMVRQADGDQVGLVSFSGASKLDFGLADVNAGSVASMVGPPIESSIVGAMNADGTTTIGGGLQQALGQFAPIAGRDRVILLLTDGIENTPPMISDIEGDLAGVRLCIVGYGDETNLDGPRLAGLAIDHDGSYTVASDELALKKFFVSCFGEIFDFPPLMDPEFTMPAGVDVSDSFPFQVCGESVITAVCGWDDRANRMGVVLTDPVGNTVTAGVASTESAAGRSWQFLRVPLPHNAQQDGTWHLRVERNPGAGEFPPAPVDERVFVGVTTQGGPKLNALRPARRAYTGDSVNPLVWLHFPTGTTPPQATVKLSVKRPTRSPGNLAAARGLAEPSIEAGDTISGRHNALRAAAAAGQVITYEEVPVELFDDGAHEDGAMGRDGVFGNPLPDLLAHEGIYTFHAVATYGRDCRATREVMWSLYADVGVDPGASEVTTAVVSTGADGTIKTQIDITPKDRFGNHLGPGRSDVLVLTGAVGTTVTSGPVDNGDGSYTVDADFDPDIAPEPGVVISQPGRDPVVVCPPGETGSDPGPPVPPKLLWWIIGGLVVVILILILVL